jgi:signal peptidase I
LPLNSEKIEKISQHLLDNGYSLKITVQGNSMFPFLLENETVKVTPLFDRRIRKGDILVFKSSGNLVAHRLIHINKKQGTFLTKGDFCFKKDRPLSPDQIIGKITIVFRKGREVHLDNPFSRFINFMIAQLSIILPYLVRVLKKLKIVKIPSEYFRNS